MKDWENKVSELGGMIYLVRGQKVMLDHHLAELYGVETKVLLQAIKRNRNRFPADFMFQLKYQDVIGLRSQFVTSSLEHGGRRYLPYVFTEQGVAMLSSVLKSKKAVQVNIEIMRAFVRMRQIVGSQKTESQKIIDLERVQKIHGHLLNEQNDNIEIIFDAICKMEELPEREEKPIGFNMEGK